VGRNFRCRLGEIDIVAREGSTLVFVEVKTVALRTRVWGGDRIGRDKARRLQRAATAYLRRHTPVIDRWRIDALVVEFVPARFRRRRVREIRWYPGSVPTE
jgi:putative endonuclease